MTHLGCLWFEEPLHLRWGGASWVHPLNFGWIFLICLYWLLTCEVDVVEHQLILFHKTIQKAEWERWWITSFLKPNTPLVLTGERNTWKFCFNLYFPVQSLHKRCNCKSFLLFVITCYFWHFRFSCSKRQLFINAIWRVNLWSSLELWTAWLTIYALPVQRQLMLQMLS